MDVPETGWPVCRSGEALPCSGGAAVPVVGAACLGSASVSGGAPGLLLPCGGEGGIP